MKTGHFAKNDTEQCRRINRRVEIEMLGKEAACLTTLAEVATAYKFN